MPRYNPASWYWSVAGDKTKVWSSAQVEYVPVTDSTYEAWASDGTIPSSILSETELAEVLTNAGVPQLAPVNLVAYAKAKQATLLAAGETVNVNAGTSAAALPVLCDGTSDTRADLGLLGLFGQASPTGTKTWLDNNGVATVLTGAQLVVLVTAVGTWVAETYGTLATVLAGIAESPATITTTAQVDAAFAADTTS